MESEGKQRKFDGKVSININRERWQKFRAYAKSLNLSASDMVNLMVVGVLQARDLEPLFDHMLDKVIEEKEKQREKDKKARGAKGAGRETRSAPGKFKDMCEGD